jgi:CRISPR/Cas system CSM-associated protein Csm3 (group 7 of RAMP superfamily)
MARPIYSRIQISGIVDVKRTLHVGGMHLDSNVDLTLAVNGKGEVYIPGTSIAGALRAWTEKAFGKPDCRLLWGYQKTGKNEVRGKDEQASAIVVEDAVVKTSDGHVMQSHQMEVRDGIGIDRHLGSTVENFQYTRGVIPRGSTFPLVLSIDCPSEATAKDIHPILNALLTALTDGEIKLGAAKSRGLGWVILGSEFVWSEHCLNTQQGLLAALRGESGVYNYKRSDQTAGAKIVLTLKWKPIGSFMVKSEQSGVAIDILPLMGNKGTNQLGFVLPGSSVKGGIRSQAERIIRTLKPKYQTLKLENQKTTPEFSKQIDLPLINSLFGKAATPESDESVGYLPGLSALSVEDCYSEQSFTPIHWQAVVKASKSGIQPALSGVNPRTHQNGVRHVEDAEMGEIQQAYHVAIDRWTGGAADKMLYTAIEPFGVVWEPITMRLDFDRIHEDDRDAALVLLLLLFRDMADRRIALGYGTNRGMGGMQLQSVEFKGVGELPDLAQKVVDQGLPDGELAHLDKDLLIALTEAWTKWLESKEVAK